MNLQRIAVDVDTSLTLVRSACTSSISFASAGPAAPSTSHNIPNSTLEDTSLHQKSDTLPLKLQSPSSVHFPIGSRLGPPRSPVAGLTSPSNSAFTGVGVSG